MRSVLSIVILLGACGGSAANDETPKPAPVNPLAAGSNSTPPANPLAGGGDEGQTPENPLAGTDESAPLQLRPSGPATAIVIGQVYSGALRLSVPTVGLQLDIPSGWQAQAPGTLPLMVVTDGSAPDVLTLVWAQRPADMSTVQALLSEPLELGPGAAMQFGPVQASGRLVSTNVQATNGSAGRVEGIVDQGAAMLVLTIAPAGQSKAGDAIRRTLLDSMQFVTAKQGNLAPQISQLRSMLAGTRLERRSSETFDGGFIGSQSMWDFCGDGSYQYSESTTTSVSGSVSTDSGSSTDELGSFNGSGSSDGDRLRGRWQLDAIGSIAGEYLQMTLQDARTGKVQFMPIAPTDTGVDFAGLSWSAVTSPLCQ